MTRDRTPGKSSGESPFAAAFDSLVRLVFWVSLAATFLISALMVYYYTSFASGQLSVPEAQASATVEMFGKYLMPATVVLAVASALFFWGEEVLGALMLLGGAGLYFAPMWLPLIAASSNVPAAKSASILQGGGLVLGIGGLILVLVDVSTRINLRIRYGAKADLMKYGKGVKVDDERQNVFLGKCWQMPFCRKFVRELCPIFHSRRTCWKERVGCMCEETVIANAMQGKTIPKDSVLAAKYIPRNSKLSPAAKAERCRQCIIYNERQRQKYKAAVPATLVVFGLIYVLLHTPLLAVVRDIIIRVDRVVGIATFRPGASGAKGIDTSGMFYFQELLLFCIMLVLLAYMMRVLEFLFFKLKV